jgi:hypothetical protein
MRVVGQRHAPAAFPKERTGILYGMLGGLRGRSGRVRIISSLLGFDPRTVQPVASRYTDYANPAHLLQRSEVKEIVEISLKIYFYFVKDSFQFLFHLKFKKFWRRYTAIFVKRGNTAAYVYFFELRT